MALENEKIVAANLFTVAGQSTTMLFVPLAGQSATGTLANTPNPFVGHRLWDSVALQWGASGNVNGTFQIDILGTVAGVTAIPIARRVGLANNNGTSTIPTTTSTACMPLPTHLNWVVGSAGTGMTGIISMVGKARRVKAPFSSGSAKIVEGILDTTTVSFPNGVTNDVTRALAANNATANTQLFQGFNKYAMWDGACYYVNVTGLSGAVTIWLLGKIAGRTTVIAQSASLTGVTKAALVSSFFGASPMPTHIMYDFTTTGDLAGISCQVLGIAKSGPGNRNKV